jgi:hypothetical protein
MPIPATLNQPIKLAVAFTLAGAPGAVDAATPPEWSLEPAANGTITPAADGMTADVTLTAIGDSVINVKADADLASGVLDLIVSETIQVVDAVNIGADGGTITPV